MQQDRKRLIQHIDETLRSKNKQLQHLKKNKQSLEKIISKIEKIVQPKGLIRGKNVFFTLKGHLNWPVKGKVISTFNAAIDNSTLRHHGILIAAPKGHPIQAIYSGKIIFSNWLRGFGFLIIIDHGQGYLSLYGRNETLLKSKGDEVESGEPIATLGSSGGYKIPALYFGIRQQSKALNPMNWLNVQRFPANR